MRLVLDLGNSALKAAWFDGAQLVRQDRHDGTDAAARIAWLGEVLVREPVDDVVAASVVPALTSVLRSFAGPTPLRLAGVDALSLGVTLAPGLTGLGSDRLIAAAAAYARARGPVIALTIGTATTFTVVDGKGVVRGGAIAPGLGLGAEALARAGAQLFQVPLEAPPAALGTETRHALQSGLVLGHAAMVDGLCDRLESELGVACACVATGGYAATVAPQLRRKVEVDPVLILRGLAGA
jgi:type III pantothenate kinase